MFKKIKPKIMEKKASVTFEVTKDKTTVTAIGTTNNVDEIDITGTELEKDFFALMRKMQYHQLAGLVMGALDITKWEEVYQ